MNDNLIKAIQTAAETVVTYSSKEVSLFHHNDTDGLCSGAILLKAFTDSGYKVSRFSLEKPYPQILERIFSSTGKVLIFADFAGKTAPLISTLNKGANLVIILDHHPAEDVDDPFVFNLDGDLFGLKGDRDISASATCYLFAEALLRQSGLDPAFLSHLGVLGAIGDGFLVDGALSGINREVLEIALTHNLMRIKRSESKEDYFVFLGGLEYPADHLCETLDTVGGVGYYQDGPSLGIEICLSGMNSIISEKFERMKKIKHEIFSRELENLGKNIKSTEHLQWFNVEDRFLPMGVKMIGVFCTMIRDEDFLDKKKYLAGFQIVPDEVPGFGAVEFNSTKISMRVSSYLTGRIRAGESPGLSSFLPDATINIGGFVDACHSLSAATTVKIGQEQLLIDEVEKEIIKRIKEDGQR
ncbi:MAG: DHH family phosphoesterase [Spirochaetales bacterium]|nr:DHH family phosphoesterase [Spirochaetales bacterium]